MGISCRFSRRFGGFLAFSCFFVKTDALSKPGRRGSIGIIEPWASPENVQAGKTRIMNITDARGQGPLGGQGRAGDRGSMGFSRDRLYGGNSG